MTPSDIRAARIAAGLTQARAASLCYIARRTWQDNELGIAPIHPCVWRVFLHRTGQQLIPVDHSIQP